MSDQGFSSAGTRNHISELLVVPGGQLARRQAIYIGAGPFYPDTKSHTITPHHLQPQQLTTAFNMAVLTQFSAPAYLTDFTPENAKRWSSEYVSPRMTLEATLPQVTQFYNELKSGWGDTPTRADISWVGFPNTVRNDHGSDRARWRRADETRDVQDEYCEWSVLRDKNNRIVRVVFTAEGPEVGFNISALRVYITWANP